MAKNFSPSVNIVNHDIDLSQYLLTSNVQAVFDILTANYRSGIRSTNLIGAYGTGKSSFLSAVTQHLSGQKVFFEPQAWCALKHFKILKAASEYDSFINQVAELIGGPVDKPQQLLKHLIHFLQVQNAEGSCVVLVFDEFGKALEYAARYEPEKELYFIQQLAELANSGDYEVALITTLHQDFAGYAHQLSRLQRNEWTKVKGRFKEITFNEPVEQLLYLVSERLNSSIPSTLRTTFDILFKTIAAANVYPLRDFFTQKVAEKLYPFDVLSAAVLAQALQLYGQNERSLFSFLNGGSYYDLDNFDPIKSNFYGAHAVYDYLNYNLHSFLHSKINPHYSQWAEIRNALERVDGEFAFEKQTLYHAIVKTIGIFQLFLPGNAKIDSDFLSAYLNHVNGISNADEAIAELEQRFIIRYYHRTHRYTLFEASDIDIDVAIASAASEVSRANDVVEYLRTYFNFPTVSAKRAYFEKGTPRVFQFKISDNPYNSALPQGEIDGFVNLVFSTLLTIEDLETISGQHQYAILYGLYQNPDEIRALIEEIEKAEIAREKHKTDRIARRELDSIIDLQRNLLNHYVMNSFFNPRVVRWFYHGQEIHTIVNNRSFNERLSDICLEIYNHTPIFKSEIANKTRLSSAASSARKELFQAMFKDVNVAELGITGFPPQKSIYYSLLLQTGIHTQEGNSWVLQEPTFEADANQFASLFNVCNEFLDSSRGAKRNVAELYEKLSKAPFKLKRGFMDFWVPIYLILKKSEYALYGEFGYITDLNAEILELLVKRPDNYAIKAFDVAGIRIDMFNRYREMLQLPKKERTSNEAFVQTIVPFIKFYKDLHRYSQHTKRISQQSQKIRKALTDADDPERLFFEDFPAALGFDLIQLNKNPDQLVEFTKILHNTIRELRSAYEELLVRFEKVINGLLGADMEFPKYKEKLQARYGTKLKQYLLLPYQRTFYDRICSPLEDRGAWLSSVAQSLIDKPLEQSNDDDELRLFDRFLEVIHELDNLQDISRKNIDFENDESYKLEITFPGEKVKQQIITVPKTKTAKFNQTQEDIEAILAKENRFTKIAILAEMLKKEIGDGK